MPELLRMPEIAAGTDRATLVDWPVPPGQTFAVPDVIAVVETEKAVVDVEAERAGTIVRTLVEPGTEVHVGEPIALVAADGETVADVDAALRALGIAQTGAAASGTPAEQPTSAPVPPAPPAVVTAPAAAAASAPPTAPAARPPASSGPWTTRSGARIFTSPLARRLARDVGVALEDVQGSGPNGRIVRRDIERVVAERSNAAAARASAAPAAPSPTPTPVPSAAPAPAAPEAASAPAAGPAAVAVSEGATEVPHSKLRRLIATRLTQSKQSIPHFYLKAGIEVDELLALRAQLNAASGVKISVNDFVIKAMATAHLAVPDANVVWTPDAMHKFDHVDIAVAIAAPNGLVTPVVRGVDTMSISTLSRTVRDFVKRAGDGRLQQAELVGGSTTVSNLGMLGTDEFSAIINPPHSSILAVAAVAKRPVVLDSGELAARSTMNVVLSVDHRAIDGALAAEWMKAFVTAVRNPLSIIV